MRSHWIGSGWKMNKVRDEAVAYSQKLRDFLEYSTIDINVFIAPPFTVISQVCDVLSGSTVKVAAQNMHWQDCGAFTGEISPIMVRDSGAQIVELGHYERRKYFGETDRAVNKKALAALNYGLIPLICIGETSDEKKYNISREAFSRQVKIALNGVSQEEIENIMIAYEPYWAIGEQGVPADPAYANKAHVQIREVIAGMFGKVAADKIHILYGGSVNLTNANDYLRQSSVDGLFIGRASLNIENFLRLIQEISNNSIPA